MTPPLKTILLEDEPNSLNLLQHLLRKHCAVEVEIIGAFEDPVAGLEAIRHLKPDLVLLDIEMPKLNGFEVLERCLPLSFRVIFTTAYNQYAVRAFKFSAIDYLLKPLIVEDLVAAVRKAAQSALAVDARQVEVLQQFNPTRSGVANRMVISTVEGLVFISVNDIVHCDSDGPYTHVHLIDGEKILISKTLRDVEELLRYDFFFRAHHSHLINLQHIKKFIRSEDEALMTNGKRIPVARSRKAEFLELVTGA
jgi:two-component system, LytTR family, response regulator